ncbi:MAG: hypothetical protein HXX18_10790 [Bacteroidetes bacterium]|nr:hypothetical protein [Bacteroidota bacterium]
MNCKKRIKILFIVLILFVKILEAQIIDGFSFEKYKVEKLSTYQKAKINYLSNPTVKYFKTRITNGYKTGKIDFAAYYITITWGCGTGCIDGAMVDVRDGKVYDLPLGESTYYYGCALSDTESCVEYKPNSRLFITVYCSEIEIENSKDNEQEKIFFINVWDEKKKEFVQIDKFTKSKIVGRD